MNAAKWNSLTAAQRAAVVKRDRSMRHPAYTALVAQIASSRYEALTPLQRAMVEGFR